MPGSPRGIPIYIYNARQNLAKQVFNCEVAASEGGGSFYADGFAVAERLRREHPEAFDFFTKTSLTYQTYDAGYHYVSEGPIFRMGPHGVVDQVHMI